MRAWKAVSYFSRFYLAKGKLHVRIIVESTVVVAKYHYIVARNEYLAKLQRIEWNIERSLDYSNLSVRSLASTLLTHRMSIAR